MKNITLSADEHLIEQARQVARSKHKTLNQEFRDWLQTYIRPTKPTEDFDELMKRVSYVRIGRKFTREEMNERQGLRGYEHFRLQHRLGCSPS